MKNNWVGQLPSLALRFFAGFSVALIAAEQLTAWMTVCGVSVPSMVVMLVSAAAGLLICELLLISKSRPQPAIVWLATAILMGGCVVFPSLLSSTLSYSSATFTDQTWLCFVVPGLFITTLAMALRWWIAQVNGVTADSTPVAVSLGMVGGLLFPLTHAAILFPSATPIAAALLISVVLWQLTAYSATDLKAAADFRQHAKPTSGRLVAAVGLGIFAHAATRFMTALMPMSLPVLLPAIAFTIAAWTAWAALAAPFSSRTRGPGFMATAFCLPLVTVLAFQSLIRWNLSLNATVDSVTLLFAARSLQIAGIWFTGLLIFKATFQPTERAYPAMSLWICFAMLGAAAGQLLTANSVSVPLCLAIGLAAQTMAILLRRTSAAAEHNPESQNSPLTPRFVYGICAAAVLFLANLPFDATSATQLLFSARAAQGVRAGMDIDVIRQSSATRLVSEAQSAEGTLTAWRTSGDQLQLRRDGVPVGQISSNTATSPQPIADVLPVILPLVMHRNASSLLLLGDDTGAAVRACSEFPVHTIVTICPDDAAIKFASQYTWPSMPVSPLNDERVQIRSAPVAVAIRRPVASSQRFDAVVAVSPNPVCLTSLEQLTPEFYAQVKAQLTEDGVFCQRITRHDIGAQPLFRIVSSISAQFARVVMLHMAEGEIAIVAGVKPDSLLDANLMTRMQRSHVGRALSRSGWDWSQVAALPAIDTNDPVGIFEHQPRLAASSPTNAHFAFALPLEAAAWADKSAELRETFAPHQQRMADAAERGPAYDEFARRFSAVVQQSEILATFPDQPWPYRRSLRTEMQRNPRPPIEKVRNGKVERVADSRDEHRKNYFVALGNVLQQAKSGTVDPISLRELTQFSAHYEPLLSYFAHHELVQIHEATGHPSPALELRHRLHTVFFTEGGDFSVRQITSAIQQILDDPELVTDTAMRFDYVNSMLQELVRRWELRRNYEPPSARQTQHEVDTSVAIAKKALDALQEWSDDVGITTEDIVARRKFINKGLISPLRTYHDQVLAHRLKNEAPATLGPDSNSGELPMLLDPTEVLGN